MRNFNRTLLSLLFFLSVSCLFAKVEVDGIFYRLDKENSLAYVTYKGESHRSVDNEYFGVLVIPNKIGYQKDSFIVEGIDSLAFSQCEKLVSVFIPSSVKTISLSAFNGCSSLRRILVNKHNKYFYSDDAGILYSSKLNCLLKAPEMVKPFISVGSDVDSFAPYAFEKCKTLKEVYLYRIDFLPKGAFRSCTNLKVVHLPHVLSSIGDQAFYGCSKLQQVSRITNLKKIGNQSFEGCLSLRNIYFADSLLEIGDRAFFSCYNLENVYLSNCLQKLGSAAFANCPSLKSFEIDEANLHFSSDKYGILYNKDKTILYSAPNLENIRYTMPQSVAIIDDYAFYGNKIKLLKLSPNLKRINQSAFQNCSFIPEITLPSSLTTIEQYAFANCDSLKRIVFESSQLNISDESVFADGYKSRSVILPYNFTNWESMFKSDSIIFCDMSYRVFIENEESLPAWFSVKRYPTKENLTATIEVVPDYGYSFLGWGDRTNTFEKNLKMDRNYFFSPKFESRRDTLNGVIYEFSKENKTAAVCGYDEAYFLSDIANNYVVIFDFITWKGDEYMVRSILPHAFAGNNHMFSCVIPETVRAIGEFAFKDCVSLRRLIVPNSVISIGFDAFEGCRHSSFEFPEGWDDLDLIDVF